MGTNEFGTFRKLQPRDGTMSDTVLSMDDILRLKVGDALFAPEGDCAEVSKLFGHDGFVTRKKLAKLRKLTGRLGGANRSTYLQIYYAMALRKVDITKLTPGRVLLCAQNLDMGRFMDVPAATLFDVFEANHPEAFLDWD